ncbi:hypothetical protein TSUD_354180 [Trifolium subterraneum]|uniref:Ubiquitin-like domain-containing protein n=1 Tax=Trifolium subterraneum TaxID=3900 RepID=A0A2Z6M2Z6_TRISU|nr:hypothetical protein TSUD_354180 [Trifolium subterraneum]
MWWRPLIGSLVYPCYFIHNAQIQYYIYFEQVNDGYGASYSFRRNCPLKKLMDQYCNQYNLDFSRVGFLFNGRLVQAEQTPHELGIEDGDEMLVMLHLRRHVKCL